MKNLLRLVFAPISGGYFLAWMVFFPIEEVKSQDILTRDEMVSDLEFLREAFVNGHPNPFQYLTPDSLNRLFVRLEADLPEVLPRYAFETRVRECVSAVHCIHTSIRKATPSPATRFLPMSVVVEGNRAWIKSADVDPDIWKPGTELLAINGRRISELLPLLRTYHSGDGPLGSFETQLLSKDNNFAGVYSRYFPADTSFLIEAKSSSRRVFIRTVAGYDRAAFKRLSPVPVKHGKKPSSYTFYRDSIDANIAVLKAERFTGNPIFVFKRCFRSLEADPPAVFVLDLRGNLGGNIYYGDKLLSYLMHDRWTTHVTSRKDQAVWKYVNLAGKIDRILAATRYNTIFMLKKSTFGDRNSYRFQFKPRKKLHYGGPVVVITDGFTASTSTVVVSYLADSKRATVIGRPTGGGDCGNSGLSYPTVQLPVSGIKVRWPYFWLDYGQSRACKGGIVPDQPIRYSVTDLLQGTDLDMDWIRANY
jgi:hypothetical protein